MKPLRYLLLAVVTLVALAGVLVWILASVDWERYRDQVARRIEETTGREVRIGGALDLEVSRSPRVVVGDVTLGNADWGRAPALLRLARLEVVLSPLDLLSGTIAAERIVLVEPVLELEVASGGRRNWVLEQARLSGDRARGGPALVVSEVEIERGRIRYRDATTGVTRTVAIERLVARAGGPDEPVSLRLRGALDDAPLQATGSFETPEAWLAGDSVTMRLDAEVGGVTLTTTTEVGEPRRFASVESAIGIRAASLAALGRLAGVTLPEAGPVEIDATVADAEDGFEFRALRASVGGSTLEGEGAWRTTGRRSRLTARLSGPSLVLDELLPRAPAADEATADRRVIPATALPAGALGAFDADASIEVEEVRSRDLVLSGVRVEGTLEERGLVLRSAFGVAEGAVRTELRLDAGEEPSAVDVRVVLEGVVLGSLVGALGGGDRLSGAPVDGEIRLVGRGATLRDVAGSAHGQVTLVAGEGRVRGAALELAGADLVTALVPSGESGDHASLVCAVVRFAIEDGVARTDRGLAVQTGKMNVIGSGSVDFATEALDIGIKPEPRTGAGISAGSVVGAARIRGTLAEPAVETDAAGALRAGASVGAAVATGGLSILAEGLLNRATADPDPCATALGRAPAGVAQDEPAGAQEAPTGEDESPDGVVDKAAEGVGKAVEGIGGALKGLFGN